MRWFEKANVRLTYTEVRVEVRGKRRRQPWKMYAATESTTQERRRTAKVRLRDLSIAIVVALGPAILKGARLELPILVARHPNPSSLTIASISRQSWSYDQIPHRY
jgi:hypothetical protein